MYYIKLSSAIVRLLLIISKLVTAVENVGDPALFLGPSPPMLPTRHTQSPQERWLSISNEDQLKNRETTSHSNEELLENAETFWPSLRPYYGVKVVPISFGASGTYGTYSDNTQGVIATRYISDSLVNPSILNNYRNSGLAGTSYGTYGSGQSGIRIFSGGAKTGWSGWGNGKWGHYGKG